MSSSASKRKKPFWLKSVTGLLVLSFLVSETSWGMPLSLSPGQPSAAGEKDPVIRTLLELPENSGELKQLGRPHEDTASSPFVVYIEDAHSNVQAQESIHDIIAFLAARLEDYEIFVGVEGAHGELHPEYFDFFPDYPETGSRVIRSLLNKGELSGADLFMWEQYAKGKTANDPARQRIHFMGVEDTTLYGDNLRAYQELLDSRPKIQKSLAGIRSGLATDESKLLNAELRDFFRERDRRKQGIFSADAAGGETDIQAYLKYLSARVLARLDIDLRDPVEQLRFPNLVRALALGAPLAPAQGDPVSAQWEEILKSLGTGGTAEEKAVLSGLRFIGERYGYLKRNVQGQTSAQAAAGAKIPPRLVLEHTLRMMNKHQMKPADFRAFLMSFKPVILQSEIDASELFRELDRLEEALVGRLAATEAEKEWVRKRRAFSLVEKLLLTELTTGDYEEIRGSREEFKSGLKDLSDAYKEAGLASSFDKAVSFYEGALKRDSRLTGWIASSAPSVSDRSSSAPRKVLYVLLAGGFHATGIKSELDRRKFPHAVLQPRMMSTDGGELYRRVMSGADADLSIYFGVANPFQTHQEAVLFRELVETAVPSLATDYGIDPARSSEMVRQMIGTHPVLSEALSGSIRREGAEAALELAPRGVNPSLPESSTIASPETFAGVEFSRAVERPRFRADAAHTPYLYRLPRAAARPGNVREPAAGAERSEQRRGAEKGPEFERIAAFINAVAGLGVVKRQDLVALHFLKREAIAYMKDNKAQFTVRAFGVPGPLAPAVTVNWQTLATTEADAQVKHILLQLFGYADQDSGMPRNPELVGELAERVFDEVTSLITIDPSTLTFRLTPAYESAIESDIERAVEQAGLKGDRGGKAIRRIYELAFDGFSDRLKPAIRNSGLPKTRKSLLLGAVAEIDRRAGRNFLPVIPISRDELDRDRSFADALAGLDLSRTEDIRILQAVRMFFRANPLEALDSSFVTLTTDGVTNAMPLPDFRGEVISQYNDRLLQQMLNNLFHYSMLDSGPSFTNPEVVRVLREQLTAGSQPYLHMESGRLSLSADYVALIMEYPARSALFEFVDSQGENTEAKKILQWAAQAGYSDFLLTLMRDLPMSDALRGRINRLLDGIDRKAGRPQNRSEVRKPNGSPDEFMRKKNATMHILRASLKDERFNRFFLAFWGILSSGYVEAASTTPQSLAYSVTRMYKLFNEYVDEVTRIEAESPENVRAGHIRSDVFTLDAELLDMLQLPGEMLGHTFVFIVGENKAGYTAEWAKILAARNANIEDNYTTTFKGRRLGRDVFIAMLRITREMPYSPDEIREIQTQIDALGQSKGEKAEERRYRGVTNAKGQILMGSFAQLREIPGSISDVAYDIFAPLRGRDDDEIQNPVKQEAVREQDIAGLTDRVGEALNATNPEGAAVLSPEAAEIVQSLLTRTLERARSPLENRLFYRPSAISIFLSLAEAEAQSHDAAAWKLVNDHVLEPLRATYHTDDVEGEVRRFTAATDEVLTISQREDRQGRLAGLQDIIRTANDQIIEMIRQDHIVAPRAIHLVVERSYGHLLKQTGKAKDLGHDMDRTYSHVIRILRREPMQEEIRGNIKERNIFLYGLQYDPYRLMHLKQQQPELFPPDAPPRVPIMISPEGTVFAHWALWAGNNGISAMILDPDQDLSSLMDESLPGQEVIVDGNQGILIFNPTEETKRYYRDEAEKEAAYKRVANRHALDPAVTATGKRMLVSATADTPEEAAEAAKQGADGIGLVRTEYLFSESNEALVRYLEQPTPENRQALVEYFRKTFVQMAKGVKGPVKIRTFDPEDGKVPILPNPVKVFGPQYYRDVFGAEMVKIELEAIALAYLEADNIQAIFPMNRSPRELTKHLGRRNLENITPREQRILDSLARDDVRYMSQLAQEVVDAITRREGEGKRAEIEQKFSRFKVLFAIETLETHRILNEIGDHTYATTDLTASLFRAYRKPLYSPKEWTRKTSAVLSGFLGRREVAFLLKIVRPFFRLIDRIVRWFIRTTVKIFPGLEKMIFRLTSRVTGVSRNNVEDHAFFNEVQPVMLSTMREAARTIAALNEARREKGADEMALAICGGLAGIPAFALAMSTIEGVTVELSVRPDQVAPMKHFIRGIQEEDIGAVDEISARPLSERLSERADLIRTRQMESPDFSRALDEVQGGVPETPPGIQGNETYVRQSYKVGPLGLHPLPGLRVTKILSQYPDVVGLMRFGEGRVADLRIGSSLGGFALMPEAPVELELSGENAGKALLEIEALEEIDMPGHVFQPAGTEPKFEPNPDEKPLQWKAYTLGALGLYKGLGEKLLKLLLNQAYTEVVVLARVRGRIFSLRTGEKIPQIAPGETIELAVFASPGSQKYIPDAINELEKMTEENEPHKNQPIFMQTETPEPEETGPFHAVVQVTSPLGLHLTPGLAIGQILSATDNYRVMALLRRGNRLYDLRLAANLAAESPSVAEEGAVVELIFEGPNANNALDEVIRIPDQDPMTNAPIRLWSEVDVDTSKLEPVTAERPAIRKSFIVSPVGLHPDAAKQIKNAIVGNINFRDIVGTIIVNGERYPLLMDTQIVHANIKAGQKIEIELSGTKAAEALEKLEGLKEKGEEYQGPVFLPAEEGPARSETREGQPGGEKVNPYFGHEGNVTRYFTTMDELHGGRLSEAIERRIAGNEGRPLKMLLIGVGRGLEAYDLLKRYGDKLDLHSLSKEDLVFSPEQLAEKVKEDSGTEMPIEQARDIIGKIQGKHITGDIENDYGAYAGETFDLIIIGQAVVEYVNDRPKMIELLKQRLTPGGEAYLDLVPGFTILDQSGSRVKFSDFFPSVSADYEIYPFARMPLALHITNNHPDQGKLYLEKDGREYRYRPVPPEARSEIRSAVFMVSTSGIKRQLLGEAAQTEAFAGLQSYAEAIDAVAEALGNLYSAEAVQAYVKDEGIEDVSPWIRQRLAGIIRDLEASGVASGDLKELASRLMSLASAAPDQSGAPEAGPAVHVHLKAAPKDPMALVPVLAVIAVFGGELHLNVAGLDQEGAVKLQGQILKTAEAKSVHLRPAQFSVAPETRAAFGSMPQKRNPEGQPLGLLGERAVVEKTSIQKGVFRFEMDEDAPDHADVLAAYIISVIRAMALDRQITDNYSIMNPRTMSPDAFGSIVQMIGTYLQAQARLSASA